MESITDVMMSRFEKKKTKGGINSPFNDAVARVKETIKDQGWSFGRWCGYLRNIPAWDIQQMIAVAEKDANPGRKFHWLVKEFKKGTKV